MYGSGLMDHLAFKTLGQWTTAISCQEHTDLMGFAVAVEEGQAIQTLVVLGEATEAEEEGADTHVHQHPSLVSPLCRKRFRHLDNLDGRLLGLSLTLAGWSLWGRLLGEGRLWRGGWNRKRKGKRTWVC